MDDNVHGSLIERVVVIDWHFDFVSNCKCSWKIVTDVERLGALELLLRVAHLATLVDHVHRHAELGDQVRKVERNLGGFRIWFHFDCCLIEDSLGEINSVRGRPF